MRLLRLDIHGFGRLRGRIDLEPGEGKVGLVLENNESGKSTLSAALLAALYGLEGDRRRFRGTITDRDRFRPWQGGAYGVTLTLRYGDEELVIERDFEQDSVRVLAGARDVTDQFQRDGQVQVGRGLTGLRKEQFTASCFVGQGDILWTDPEHLTEALQRVADSRSGKATAAHAIAALDRAVSQYNGTTLTQPGRVETEIKRCEEKIAAAGAALAKLEQQKDQIDARFGADGAVDEDHLWPNVQRKALRARRLRRELDAIEELLASDAQVGQRVAAAQAELAEHLHLDVIDDTARATIERARRDRERLRPELSRAEADTARWQKECDTLEVSYLALGLRRVPTTEEIATLGAAWQGLQDLRAARAHYLAELEGEKRRLDELGVDMMTALALARDFEELDDDQRVRLVSRTPKLMESQERRQELETELSTTRRELVAVASEQELRRRVGFILLGSGVLLAALVFALGTQIPYPFAVPAGYAVAGLLAVLGIARTVAAPRHRNREAGLLQERVHDVGEELRALEADQAEQDRIWEALSTEIGIAPALLEARYRDWRRIESRVSSVVVLRQRLDELSEEEQRILSRLAIVATIFERPPALDQIEPALQRAAEAIDLDRSRRVAEHEIERLRSTWHDAESRVERAELALILALEDVGVGCEEPAQLEQALAEFDRRSAAARERAHRRQTELPALEERMLDPERRREAQERAAVLREELPRLEQQVRERAASEGARGVALVASLEFTLGQSEFERATTALDAQLAREREQVERARAEIGTFLARYGDEAAQLRADLEHHTTALRRAVQFRDAIALARETLQKLGQQTHRIWAAQLNRHSNELLKSMGSEVEDLRFDDTLAVQVRQRGHVIANADLGRVLSTGAAEGVFLAARLAVARALGRDRVPLPLVLDDPFANADDERLLASLRLLVDAIAPQQQVLLMACQHSRYEWSRNALASPELLVPLRLRPVGEVDPASH